MTWLRLYVSILNDPKVATLPPDVFRAWVLFLCVASDLDSEGVLPMLPELAFRARMSPEEAGRHLDSLAQVGLLENAETGRPAFHRWRHYQPPSDNAAKRMSARRGGSPRPIAKAVPNTDPASEPPDNPTATAAVAASETDADRCRNFVGATWPSSVAFRRRVEDWLKNHSSADVLAALAEAAERGATSPNYVAKILASPTPDPTPPPTQPAAPRRRVKTDPDTAARRAAELAASLKTKGVPEW